MLGIKIKKLFLITSQAQTHPLILNQECPGLVEGRNKHSLFHELSKGIVTTKFFLNGAALERLIALAGAMEYMP